VFDGFRAALVANRSQFYLDVASGPFYNFDRPGVTPVEGQIRNWWRQGMIGGAKAHYDCIKVFSETDLTLDLTQIEVPVLLLHSEDDQIVPLADSAVLAVKLLKNGTLKTYRGVSHGCMTTHPEMVNRDILAFIRGGEVVAEDEKIIIEPTLAE
jgi:non-heme chloroperoxidase